MQTVSFNRLKQGRASWAVIAATLTLGLVMSNPAAAGEPLKVGEYADIHLETPHPYPVSLDANAPVWEDVISHPGATYISVHFAHFNLAEGDWVEITNPLGGPSYKFTRNGTHDAGTFWATHVKGDMMRIRLYSQNPRPEFGYVIDRYAHGFVSLGPLPGQDSLCGADDRENAACYGPDDQYAGAYSAEYDAARPVARLLIQGSSLCTGSLVSCDNHFFTNEHCINSQTQATNTDYEFMAEAPNCNDANCQLCFPGNVLTGATFIQASSAIDYGLVQFSGAQNPVATYGYNQIASGDGSTGDRIFLPQHSGGDAKEFGIFSDSTASGFCEITGDVDTSPTCSDPGVLDTGYWCDSEGGSSGSPVMSRQAGADYLKVIGLNHCSIGCAGTGSSTAVKITNVLADLTTPLPGCSFGQSWINLDLQEYRCSDTANIEVYDVIAISASAVASRVTITTSNGDSETIAAGDWTGSGTCAFGNCTNWTATLPVDNNPVSTGNGVLNVTDGGTITADYNDTHGGHSNQSDNANVDCSPDVSTYGVFVSGGCDAYDPGPPEVNPQEKYVPYMDTGEYISLTYIIQNDDPRDFNDLTIELQDSSGCLNILSQNPVSLGLGYGQDIQGASWSIEVGACANLVPVTFTAVVTSPSDGLTVATNLSDVSSLINADDNITEYNQCWDHTSNDWTPVIYGTSAALPWTQISNTACGGEDRTDGPCGDGAETIFHTASRCQRNHSTTGDEVLFSPTFGPNNTGAAPSGEPWRYNWKTHSFYGSTETVGNKSLVWGVFYNDDLGSAGIPGNGTAVDTYPFAFAYYYQTYFDGASSWDWDAANGGTPEDPSNAPPDQSIINADIAFGLSTPTTYWSIGHEAFHYSGTAADMALDNQYFVWDEMYAEPDQTVCSSAQCGEISFDRPYYQNACPPETVTIMVADENGGAGPLTATVVSAGTNDSEDVTLFKQGSDPLYVGTITLSTMTGVPINDGTLWVRSLLDDLTATYNDTGDSCSDTAVAQTFYPVGDVGLNGRVVTDNGDNDGYADTNETVTFSLEFINNMTVDLVNPVVTIGTRSPLVDCIFNDTANYATIAAGGTGNTPGGQLFSFHVSPTYNCSDPANPDTILFNVNISGDGMCGPISAINTVFYADVDEIPGPRGPAGGAFRGPIQVTHGSATGAAAVELQRIQDAIASLSERRENVQMRPRGASAITPTREDAIRARLQAQDPGDLRKGRMPGEPVAVEEPDSAAGTLSGLNLTVKPQGGAPQVLQAGFPSTDATTCGNAQYDDGTTESVFWFGGGNAGDPNFAVGVLFNPADFGLPGAYNISEVCFGNDLNVGVPADLVWHIYADSGGLPTGAPLASGMRHVGDGAGQSVSAIAPAVSMPAGASFWLLSQGDASTAGEAGLIWESSDGGGHSYSTTTGLANMALDGLEDYVMHAQLDNAVNFVCDTNNNSALPGCSITPAPPGEAGKATSTTALRARKGAGAGDIQVAFGNACNAVGHGLYWSDQGFPIASGDWTSASCAFMDSDGLNTTYDAGNTFNPSSGNQLIFFVIVGHDGAEEGSYGQATGGAERPDAGNPQDCQAQNLVGNCI